MHERGIIKLHYECNNNCIFCHSARYRGKKTTFRKIMRKLLAARELGLEQIIFSGGEPTTYVRFMDALKYAQKLKLLGGVITNGRMLAYDKLLIRLLRHDVTYFYISLHSGKAEIHDAITRTMGSWEQVIRGLRNLAKHSENLDTMINCVVTKYNIDELDDFVRLLAKMGIRKIKFSYPEKKGNAVCNTNDIVSDMKSSAEKICGAMTLCDDLEVESFYDGLPFCFMDGRYRNRINNLESSGIYYISEVFENEFFRTDESDREKKSICAVCSYNEICEGYYCGYDDQLQEIELKPIVETIPNFVACDSIDDAKPSFHACVLDYEKSFSQFPFKRLILQNDENLTLCEAESGFFKVKSFQTAKNKGLVYLLEENEDQNRNFVERIKKLRPIEPCRVCTKGCPGIYTVDENSSFIDRDGHASAELEELSGNVLDIGCGDVYFADIFFGKLQGRIDYYGIEPNENKYHLLSKLYPDEKMYNMSLEESSFEEGFFDYALMLGSYNHIRDIVTGLQIIYRLLRSDGKVIVAENETFILVSYSSVSRKAGFLTDQTGSTMVEEESYYEHYRNHNLEEAAAVFRAAGFRIESKSGFPENPHGSWSLTAKKLLSEKS